MSRMVAEWRISIKRRGKKCHKIELIPHAVGKRFLVRTNGKNSRRLPSATATDISDRIRSMLVGQP